MKAIIQLPALIFILTLLAFVQNLKAEKEVIVQKIIIDKENYRYYE